MDVNFVSLLMVLTSIIAITGLPLALSQSGGLEIDDIYGNTNPNNEITVEKLDNDRILVKDSTTNLLPLGLARSTVIYNGSNATEGIQAGLNSLSRGEKMHIYNGTYTIDDQLNFTDYTHMSGQGNDTVLDYSGLTGEKDAMQLGIGSQLRDVKLSGSIDPLPMNISQRVKAKDNVEIESITISHMGYGIDTVGDNNVTLKNVRCEYVQSVNDWAACIHAGPSTRNLEVKQFVITDSNRGVVVDAPSINITVQNGHLSKIKNFNNTGNEPFSLDVHTHEGDGKSNNITFRHVYMTDSYAPSTKIAADRDRYSTSDLPTNIVYENITLVNPTSAWQTNGEGISIKDSQIINSRHDNFVLYTNSRDISIENVTSNALQGNKHFILNTPKHTGIHNVSVIQSTIYDQPSKRGPTMLFNNISGLTLIDNQIINAPNDTYAVSTHSVSNLISANNNLIYPDVAGASTQVENNEGMPKMVDPQLKVERVFEGLELPTSMAFLGPDDILVLEKSKGTVQRIVQGEMLNEPLLKVNVSDQSERGMLGIAVADERESGPRYVFLYFTEESDDRNCNEVVNCEKGNRTLGNRLYRYELVNNETLTNAKLLMDLPVHPHNAESPPNHNGGRVLIGPDQNVYLTIGDVGGHETKAQNIQEGTPANGSGGILRLTQDGQPVSPGILGQEKPLNFYYAYGIRNSFGIDFDPVTGNLWDTENGPDYGDEINLVQPGFNSGWKKVQGMSSTEATFEENSLVNFGGKGNYSDPEFVWNIPSSPTALEFLTSKMYGEQYQNDMFVGSYNRGLGYSVLHFSLQEDRTNLDLSGPLEDKIADNNSEQELRQAIFVGPFNSVTDIQVGPDGYLYILSSVEKMGSIFRVVPNGS